MSKHWGTLVLAMMASVCVFLLRLQGSTMPAWLIAEWILMLGSAIITKTVLAQTRWGTEENEGRKKVRVVLWLIGAFWITAPWLSKAFVRSVLGADGEATELVWLGMLQHAAVWQAAIATTSRQEWISFLLSCFLAIFGLATSDRTGMVQVVGPFALMAAWWLMARYWNSIEGGFVASQSVPLFRMRLLVLSGMVAVSVVVFWIASTRSNQAMMLDGFMPTSGGKQRADASARQGVGDGDMLVAAQDEAFTFGPVDSDLFLESDVPSMYDLVSEIYGEATNKKRKYARAISLDNQVQESEREGTESKKNSREFSALRTPKDRTTKAKPEGTESRAVVQLIGRTPAWLRLESFDRFEENTWTQSESLRLDKRYHEPELHALGDKPWMLLQSPPRDLVYPVRERLAIKVIQFLSPRLLTPSIVTHVHIDRIDQPDFFSWTSDGQLMMPNREHVPQLTVVHQLVQIPQLHVLRDPNNPISHLAHTTAAHGTSNDPLAHYLQLDSNGQSFAERTKVWLEQAMNDRPQATDWDKVQAIVARCREEFVEDGTAAPPESCKDVLEHLWNERRGPDYLIASAAVVAIRNMGIPCRLCRGFYASPRRYDLRSGQTEVMPEDLHTWAEVYVHGAWLTIEPCGTYPLPTEHRTWQQWAIQCFWSIQHVVLHRPLWVALVVSAFGLLVYLRQRILESMMCGIWVVVQWLPMKPRIRWTLRLLQWRMWVWGERVPHRATVESWLGDQLSLRSRVTSEDRERFIRAVQSLAYAPRSMHARALETASTAIQRVCWSVVWSGIMALYSPRQRLSDSSASYSS